MKTIRHQFIVLITVSIVAVNGAFAQGNTITYQGRLADNGASANGTYDLRFVIYDAASDGSIAGGPLTNTSVGVSAGNFSVTLDFGSGVFTGAPRWLEIGVRTNGSAAAYTTLAPRQPLTATPYAVQSLTASNVLGNIADVQLSPNIARVNGNPTFVGTVSFSPLLGAPFKVNNGSVVTNLNADFLDGLDSTAFAPSLHTHSAGDIVSGALGDARLSLNVPLLNRAQTFSASNSFTGVLVATNGSNLFGGAFAGNGAGLANLNAANLTGSLNDALLSANVARLNAAQIFTGGVTFSPAAGAPFAVNNATRVSNLNADLLDGLDSGAFWNVGGNAGTTAANFIGTLDNQPLELRANNTRVLRLIPTGVSPNLIGGSAANNASVGIVGATIAGGGPVNSVSANYATVSGGSGNTASGVGVAVAGGLNNAATNTAAFVAGGSGNIAGGQNSLAAGQSAQALHGGTFVWADTSSVANFASTALHTVIFRAAGGVGIGTNAPQAALHVAGTVQSSGLKMTTSPANGALLMSDASGNGTWQPAAVRAIANATSPNTIGGHASNTVAGGISGATISGGGTATASNSVAGNYGTVAGGSNNRAAGGFSAVAGGTGNTATGGFASVGGGYQNSAGDNAAVAGGAYNAASGPTSFVGGGNSNQATNSNATVSGGNANIAGGDGSVVTGGNANFASGFRSVVAGGDGNRAQNSFAAVGGGLNNTNSGYAATVSGGQNNSAGGTSAVVPGGLGNIASGQNSFAAGRNAQALHDGAFVWSDFSSASPFASTVANQFLIRAAGGVGIAGNTFIRDNNLFFRNSGDQNHGIGWFGAAPDKPFAGFYPDGPVVFGYAGGALGTRVGGDRVALAWDSNQRVGIGATNPGGPLDVNTGAGNIVFRNEGGFVPSMVINNSPNAGILRFRNAMEIWPSDDATRAGKLDVRTTTGNPLIVLDGQSGSVSFGSQVRQMMNLWGTVYGIGVQSFTLYHRTDGQFAWYRGGVHSDAASDPGGGGTLLMRLDASGNLYTAGAVNPPSDRYTKTNFAGVNGRDVLERLVTIPVQSWNYKTDSATRHIGPMAQDFYAAFRVGTDDKHIATVDADGVALAAIQGLNQKVEEQHRELKQKQTEIAELKRELGKLQEIVGALADKLDSRVH